MTSRFHIHAYAALFVLAMLYVTATLMGGIGTYQLMRIAPIILFFLLFVLIVNRESWLAILLSAWILSFRIPVFLFDTMTIGFVVAMLVIGVFVIEKTIKQQKMFSINDFAGILLLIAGSLIMIRLLYDRPGSARIGGSGGLRYAINYAAAVPFFFVADQLAREKTTTTRIIRFLAIVSFLMLLGQLASRLLFARYGGPPIYFNWYAGPLRALMPLALAFLLARKHRQGKHSIWVILFCFFWLGMSFLSSFRSWGLFAVAAMCSVFWCYGYKKRMMAAFIIGILAAATALPLVPKSHIPVILRRSLSTFVEFDSRDISQMRNFGVYTSHETGWSSDFRASLIQMAFQQIRENPLTGTGWRFTVAELDWASQFSVTNPTASALVVSGDYHNSLLTVAVKCGLPAALALSVGLLLLLIQGVKFTNHVEDGHEKVLYAGLLGFLAALSGEMLMNGAGEDLQAICAILGYFHGSIQKKGSIINEASDVETV